MDIDPRRLGYLLAVSRTNSVVGAAAELRVSPSAVSQQIARLESETRVTILDRHTSGVTLTRAGKVLAEAAEAIESELQSAARGLLALGGEVTGTVRVGSFQSVISGILLPLLANLDERLPGIDLVIHEVTGEDAHPALRSGDLDLIILELDSTARSTTRSTTPRGLGDAVLLDEPWFLVTPSSLPEVRKLADAADRPWLDVDRSTAGGRAVRRVTTGLGIETAPHRALDHWVSLLMVAAGLGTTVLPALALEGQVPEGISIYSFPGLGARRIVARHRATRGEPSDATRAVINAMIDVSLDLAEHFEDVTE